MYRIAFKYCFFSFSVKDDTFSIIVAGDKVCMVDFMLWPWFERMPLLNRVIPETSISQSEYPHLSAWVNIMYDQPAVKATMFDLDKHAHFLMTYREKRWDYDHGIDETETISKL